MRIRQDSLLKGVQGNKLRAKNSFGISLSNYYIRQLRNNPFYHLELVEGSYNI